MVIDYSERRQSQRTQQPKRPTRPSVWPYALIILALLVVAFLIGVASGWYLFRPGGKFCKTPLQPQVQVTKPAPQPQAQPATAGETPSQPQGQPPQQPLNALPPAAKGAPVPLTFYNTLQKGNKELMGTGINQPKEGQGGAAKPATQAPAER